MTRSVEDCAVTLRSGSSSQKEIRDTRKALLQRHDDARRTDENRSSEISRMAAGVRAKVGDRMLVKEEESMLASEGVHLKLAHKHRTGPL